MGKTKKNHGSEQSSSVDDKVDLIQLLSNTTTPTEDDIVSILQGRFKHDLPYTRLSSSSLVVVNPNKNLAYMSDASAKEYADQWYKDTSGNKSALQPHIYELAAKVYMHMRRTAEDQSVIFSGVTGSGKTATQGHLLQQLLLLSTHTKKESKIANQIQNAQIILEAFGNSKTQQNINASRFGKYLELQFNERGRIVGAKTLTYCFDKARITEIPLDERTYHVFYYLLAGATPEEKSQFHLLEPHQYNYLAQSKCYKIPDVDDSIQMDDLRASLKILGFKSRTIGQIFQILSAILLLGNVEFVSYGKAKDEAATVKNHNILDLVAQYLGVPAFKLEQTLTYKTKCIGKELCTVFLNAEAAVEQRDALARALYSILFTWIVEHINSKLIQSDEPPNFIGLLDQPGYQNFTKNSFEQFCLNFATEEIQNFVLQQIFDDSVGINNEIIQDGISLPNITTMDNNGCVELLRGNKSDNAQRNSSSSSGSTKVIRGGLISVLDSECAKVQSGEGSPDDSKLLSTLKNTFSSHHSFVSNPKTSSKSGAFGINHFAGSVTYTVDQFIDKNLDNLGPDFINLFNETNNSFIRKLFNGPALAIESHPKNENTVVKAQLPTKPMRSPSMKRKKSNAGGLSSIKEGDKVPESEKDQNNLKNKQVTTVTIQLYSTLNQLTDTLKETRMWNVFQIRPNDANEPDSFDAKRVKSQVRSFLIRDIITRKRIEYTSQYTFEDFLTRYEMILASLNLEPSRNPRQKVEAFATISGWGENQISMGNKYVYLSYSIWKELEDSLRAAEKEDRAKTKLKDDDSLVSGPAQRGINTASVTSSADRLLPKSGTANYSSSETGYYEDSYAESEDEYSKTGGAQFAEDEEGSMWGSEWGGKNSEGQSPTRNRDIEANNEKEEIEEIPTTKTRIWWVRFVWLCTWWIPSFLLAWIGKMKRPDVQMAWREKFTLCLIIFFLSAFIIFYIIFFGNLICPNKDKAYKPEQIATHQGDDDFWVSVRGKVYDISKFHKTDHSRNPAYTAGLTDMQPYGGQDVTYMIPIPLGEPDVCGDLINNPSLVFVDYSRNTTGQVQGANLQVHQSGVRALPGSTTLKNPRWYWDNFLVAMKANNGLKADVVYSRKEVADQADQGRKWGIVNNKIYDLTLYFDTAGYNQQYPDRPQNPAIQNFRYFDDAIETFFDKQPGGDYTDKFNGKALDEFLDPVKKQLSFQCLENVFYVGKIDFRDSFQCQFNNYLLLVAACVMCSVILVKFLAALQLGARRKPEDNDKFVICQVPCYTEGEDSLKRTMDSLAALTYDDKRKLLFLIADGMIVGSGNDRPTPKIVLDILGVDPKVDPEPLAFKSVGEGMQQLNYGKVYSGLYEYEGHVVPYIVVVKVGKQETERSRPGNRGKRDSQIILMGFLNKVHFDLEMTPLELEIYHQMTNVIGVNPSFYEYVLMVDADTEVLPDSLNRMISCMLHDGRIIGICGETTLINEEGSWTTMIQVYEYYISHHLAKAFESLFGSVTCLPGCFCMYRIRTPTKNSPLIISSAVIEEYSENHVDTLHKKNLLSLGEDRYLTTLMMKHFPQYKMTFTPDAMCRTAAPDRWAILLSQRRRWINSTVHNLMELMFLPEMCGFCCFSMRFVVFIDLFGTLILPSTVVYIIYLIWAVATNRQDLPTIALIMLAAVYGLQAIIFILKRQWQHVGWMIIYLLAFPLFSFFIPVYSFWHFDDFSWGNTRVVLGEKGKKQIITSADEEKFDEKMIPRKKWADYEQELWEVNTAESHESGYSKRSGASGQSYKSKGSGRAYNDNASQYGGSQYGGGGGGSVYGGSQFGGGDYYRDTNLSAPADRRPRSRSPAQRYPSSESNRMSRAYSNSGDDIRNSPLLTRDLEYNPPSRPISSYSTDGGPTDEEVLAEIRQILQTANLMSITKKQVREQLTAVFNMDMTSRKEFINNSIELILQGKL